MADPNQRIAVSTWSLHHLLGTIYPHDLTTDAVMEMLGVSADWVRRERTGIFDLEHHIWFQNEVHVGDEVALHIRFTERNAKRVVGLVFLCNETRGELASVIEFLSTGADLDARCISRAQATACAAWSAARSDRRSAPCSP